MPRPRTLIVMPNELLDAKDSLRQALTNNNNRLLCITSEGGRRVKVLVPGQPQGSVSHVTRDVAMITGLPFDPPSYQIYLGDHCFVGQNIVPKLQRELGIPLITADTY